MPRRAVEPRRWHCDVCGRRVFRVEVTAAAVRAPAGRQVRFHALGACHDHQPEIRRRVAMMWPASADRVSAHIRVSTLPVWAASARKELRDDGDGRKGEAWQRVLERRDLGR